MISEIHPEVFTRLEQDEYETFGRPPKGFDPRDPAQIQIFAERLRGIRETRNAKSPTAGEARNTKWLAKDLAAELNVTPMTISKYENGKMKSIPMHHLRRICAFYTVSPHYLLGYVEEEQKYLWLEKDGTIRKDECGAPKILVNPMRFEPASFVKAVDAYKNLYQEDAELFWILYDIMVSQDKRRDQYRKVLSALIKLKN